VVTRQTVQKRSPEILQTRAIFRYRDPAAREVVFLGDSTDGHANFVFQPPWRQPWREVFGGTGLQVRHYADGSVRITVGTRQSTRAVLAAVAPIAGR